MPKKMEEALKREAAKKGLKGKRKDAYVYGTMSKHGWKRGMSEKEAKSAMRKKALGLACVLLCGLVPPLFAQQPVTPPTTFVPNPNTVFDPNCVRLYGFYVYTQECFVVPTDNDGTPSYGEVRTFIPWFARASADTVGYRARYMKVVAKKGDGMFVRAFGPHLYHNVTNTSTDQQISVSPDSTAVELAIPMEVDSLWLWDTSGTGNVCVYCF